MFFSYGSICPSSSPMVGSSFESNSDPLLVECLLSTSSPCSSSDSQFCRLSTRPNRSNPHYGERLSIDYNWPPMDVKNDVMYLPYMTLRYQLHVYTMCIKRLFSRSYKSCFQPPNDIKDLFQHMKFTNLRLNQITENKIMSIIVHYVS